MILNYKEYCRDCREDSEPLPTVFFLHGLLGSADNWGTFCRDLSGKSLRCIAVDQRNHGSSPHFPDMDYPLMAGDLVELADSLDISRFSIVGHSMGGKTAMETALGYPERVKSIVVADIAPVEYEPEYREYIDSLKLVDLAGIRRKSEAGAILNEYIPDRRLSMFFLTNLRKEEDGHYRWRINIDGITSNYDNIWRGIEGGRSFNGRTLFLKGADSDFIIEEYMERINCLFPSYRLETIEKAGHWLHVDQPDKVKSLLAGFLGS